MISIIVCSRNKIPTEAFRDNVNKPIGINYELIWIDNSDNCHSIYSAYNLRASRSKYPYLSFVHEDVMFHTGNWGEKIIAHLHDPKTGIFGLAGDNLVTRIPARIMMESANIIQSDRREQKGRVKITFS